MINEAQRKTYCIHISDVVGVISLGGRHWKFTANNPNETDVVFCFSQFFLYLYFQIVDILVSLQSLFAWWWGVSITGVENRADTCEIVNTTSPLFTLERDTAVVEIETVSHNVHARIHTRNSFITKPSFSVTVLFPNITSTTTTATVSCYFTAAATTTTVKVG